MVPMRFIFITNIMDEITSIIPIIKASDLVADA